MISDHNKHHLAMEDKEIILIGTAHVSMESADLVASVIEEEKPDTVAVELCASRYQAMTEENRWKETDLIKVIKEKKAFNKTTLNMKTKRMHLPKKLKVLPFFCGFSNDFSILLITINIHHAKKL